MNNSERHELLSALDQVRSCCVEMTGGIRRCQQLDRQYQDVMAQLRQARTIRTGTLRTAVVAMIMVGAAVLAARELIIAVPILVCAALVYLAEVYRWGSRVRKAGYLVGGALTLLALGDAIRRIVDFDIRGVWLVILLVGVAVVAVLVVRGLGAGHAVSVAVRNRSRAAHNDQVYAAALRLAEDYLMVVAELDDIRSQVRGYCEGWYPPDYLSLEAVEYFIHAVRNYKADSIREAVLLFDQAGFQQAMLQANQALMARQEELIAGQQQMVGELRQANLLSASQLAAQLVTHQRIGVLSAQVHGVRSQLSGISDQLGDMNEHLDRLGRTWMTPGDWRQQRR